MDADGKVAMGDMSSEPADSKTAGSNTAQSLDQITGGDTIVIPEKPTETV